MIGMAGHSKWKNIRIRKGKQDALKGKVFTKLAREIIVAAKAGGGDPDANLRLRMAVDKARESSMPKENIDRAIKKGTGEIEGEQYDELLYEGKGPGGVGVLVEVYSENRNRTVADLRHAFTKCGGSLTENGSVSWQFKTCGQFVVPKSVMDEESLTLAALDAGAEDVHGQEEEYWTVLTPIESLHACVKALAEQGIQAEEPSIARIPTHWASPEPDDLRRLVRLLDMLEDLDDVKQSYINAEIPDEFLEEA